MKVFLISPVRKADPEITRKMQRYVRTLERAGHQVHWPLRDTNQDDPTGGYEICKTNFEAIWDANEIHIWYDETSGGSKFDMGGVFMLYLLGWKKKIVIANEREVVDNTKKSFFKVFRRLVQNSR